MLLQEIKLWVTLAITHTLTQPKTECHKHQLYRMVIKKDLFTNNMLII